MFPKAIETDTVFFTVELDTRTMPPATPTSPFYWYVWSARNTVSRPIRLQYCFLGIRLYRGSRIVWEDFSQFSHCVFPQDELIVPGGEHSIGSAGTPEFYLGQGVPEGQLLLTVRWQLSGMADTLEIQADTIELLENNGLIPPEEPGAETQVHVSGRSRTASGDPVRGFVGVRVHWENCDRFPVLWDTIGTEVDGSFEHTATLEEGILDACVTVLVEPFNPLQGGRKIVEAGRLRLRKPAPGGARDSLQIDVVF